MREQRVELACAAGLVRVPSGCNLHFQLRVFALDLFHLAVTFQQPHTSMVRAPDPRSQRDRLTAAPRTVATPDREEHGPGRQGITWSRVDSRADQARTTQRSLTTRRWTRAERVSRELTSAQRAHAADGVHPTRGHVTRRPRSVLMLPTLSCRAHARPDVQRGWSRP